MKRVARPVAGSMQNVRLWRVLALAMASDGYTENRLLRASAASIVEEQNLIYNGLRTKFVI
jgi:hypothetical protein